MTELFGPAALDAQLKKLPDLPANEGGVGVSATSDGDLGVQGTAHVDIGKPGGFFVAAEGSWMRKAGGAFAGWLGWKKT